MERIHSQLERQSIIHHLV